ncbi:MAG: tagaturonate reductase [Clostridia bacterium]|nr:tagaturonate reductase [Clostridia bacterium]
MKEKIIQFGEGGFLRGFADWMIQIINENTDFDGSAVVVQPIEKGLCDLLSSQDCVYTHLCRGSEGVDMKKIEAISRCVKPYDDFDAYLSLASNPDFRFVISNTTESGICFDESNKITDRPASSFPGKLTQLLKKRFEMGLGGFVFLPCELIDKNGENLKSCILKYADLWSLSDAFKAWIENDNIFCNTLVDRINTGYPKDEVIDVGFDDKMINTSEYFHLWVIEGYNDLCLEIPFDKCGLNVIITNNLEMYRTRKVRILNGAHTSLVPYALLSGLETVKECTENAVMREHLRKCIYEEIIPTLDLPRDELIEYADNVLLRFSNPYIKHMLSSIALNSVSKFKVRVLPSILEYIKRYDKMPETLLFSFAKLIDFYRTDMTNDDAEIESFMKTASLSDILAKKEYWGEDLSFLYDGVAKYVNK